MNEWSITLLPVPSNQQATGDQRWMMKKDWVHERDMFRSVSTQPRTLWDKLWRYWTACVSEVCFECKTEHHVWFKAEQLWQIGGRHCWVNKQGSEWMIRTSDSLWLGSTEPHSHPLPLAPSHYKQNRVKCWSKLNHIACERVRYLLVDPSFAAFRAWLCACPHGSFLLPCISCMLAPFRATLLPTPGFHPCRYSTPLNIFLWYLSAQFNIAALREFHLTNSSWHITHLRSTAVAPRHDGTVWLLPPAVPFHADSIRLHQW